MSSKKLSPKGLPPPYIFGAGVDQHVIEIRSKLHPYTQKNLDVNVLHMFGNTLVLGPHWFGNIPEEMAKLFVEDVDAPLCYQSSSQASHTCVSKNLSRSYPSSEVRNSTVKWSDWIHRLLLKYGEHWKRAGIYDPILLSK